MPAHATGFDQRPGSMADHAHGLARVDEGFDEGDGLGLHAQRIGIDDTARQYQRVVILRVRIIECLVDLDFSSPFLFAPAVHFAPFEGDHFGVGAGFIERTARLDQLALFETVRGQKRYPETAECLACHVNSPDT